MRLTEFTDYGLRALMKLAARPGETVTIRALAAELRLSGHHLTKIMQRLAASGIVETRRGTGGGVRLAKPAARIRLGDTVKALEQPHAIVECFKPGQSTCTLLPGCRLRTRLQRAESAFLVDLNRSTLADISEPAGTADFTRK